MDPKAVDDRDVNTGGTREPGETRERTAIRSYVALGDSFTAGTGCDPGLGWADRLARALPDGAVYRNLAKHGATSADVRTSRFESSGFWWMRPMNDPIPFCISSVTLIQSGLPAIFAGE